MLIVDPAGCGLAHLHQDLGISDFGWGFFGVWYLVISWQYEYTLTSYVLSMLLL